MKPSFEDLFRDLAQLKMKIHGSRIDDTAVFKVKEYFASLKKMAFIK